MHRIRLNAFPQAACARAQSVDELSDKNEKVACRVPNSKARLPHLKVPHKTQIVAWMACVARLAKDKPGMAIRAGAHARMPGTSR